MKKIKWIAALMIIWCLSGCYPVPVTDNSEPGVMATGYIGPDYYYYPDYEVYYYPASSQYIYYSGSAWTYTSSLPARYNIDLNSSNRVVINYKGKDPYRYHARYRREYPRGYVQHQQVAPAKQSRPERRAQLKSSRKSSMPAPVKAKEVRAGRERKLRPAK